jgi:hypothetical protein
MNRFVTIVCTGLCVVLSSAAGFGMQSEPPASFTLLEPANGTHLVLTDPLATFSFHWEDVLELDGNGNGPTGRFDLQFLFSDGIRATGIQADHEDDPPDRYYNFIIGLDPNLQISFGDEGLTEPSMEVIAGGAGVVFLFVEMLTGMPRDTVTIYWTIAAVNEAGTTLASDTFYVSLSVENEPPSDDFALLEPEDGAIAGVRVYEDPAAPFDEEITFTWEATTDPEDDALFYFWVLSEIFPIPDIMGYFFSFDDGNNDSNDDIPLLVIFPSGHYQDFDEIDVEFGGVETFVTIPNEWAYYWFLGEEVDEKNFYWTVVASDGFRFVNWVPGRDTSAVTFRKTVVNVDNPIAGIPEKYSLFQNYPNPFNPSTTIRFALPEQTQVTLDVYNLLGQRVATLIAGEVYHAGYHNVGWDGRDQSGRPVASGIYVYRIQADDFSRIGRMVYIR